VKGKFPSRTGRSRDSRKRLLVGEGTGREGKIARILGPVSTGLSGEFIR